MPKLTEEERRRKEAKVRNAKNRQLKERSAAGGTLTENELLKRRSAAKITPKTRREQIDQAMRDAGA